MEKNIQEVFESMIPKFRKWHCGNFTLEEINTSPKYITHKQTNKHRDRWR